MSDTSKTTSVLESARRVSLAEVAEYYDSHQVYYTHFWSPTSLHYGLWYEDTENLAAAITNTDQLVTDSLAIEAADFVLDAGCGVGGTSVFIATKTGARVVGITLSEVQLRIAQETAGQSTAAALLSFSRQDYCRTEFADSTFSKLLAIESMAHANDKRAFLSEAFRLLQPGGRIAIIDVFLTKEQLDAEEQRIYTRFMEGWAVPNVATHTQFANLLAEAGFERIAFHDLRRYVKRSVDRIYRVSFLTSPVNFVKAKLGLVRENLSARYQKAFFERLAIYGMFIAHRSAVDERLGDHNENRDADGKIAEGEL